MRLTHIGVCVIAFLIAACSGGSLQGAQSAAVIQILEPIDAPGERGPYDLGWHVELQLDRMSDVRPGDYIEPFMAGEASLRLDAVLQEHERGAPEVWRGRLHDDDGQRGSFTITRQGSLIMGRLRAGQHVYSLEGDEEARVGLYRIDPDKLPPPGPPMVPDENENDNQ
ncbi:hypothetical protein [Natronospira bacteriovora]|uniref:Uncharacterized protein n=1 Tax=Natronospira bacteriovora TaxID=3069753 RepID=A0ABU0W7T1_9GAMM|nr:hypothetical protein [Natronospira sp. AB-CW4]MDQ2070089.1 hypothetical protein [Natronospira sp. AB-CW4]